MTTKREWAAIIGLVLVMIIGGCVEPCDGHSCDAEVMQHE